MFFSLKWKIFANFLEQIFFFIEFIKIYRLGGSNVSISENLKKGLKSLHPTNYQGASGCEGAPLFSNMEWVVAVGKERGLSTAAAYPYQDRADKADCTNKTVVFHTEAAVLQSIATTTTGTEKELQDLMYSHTAASVAGVCFSPAEWERFQAYTGGIFKACGPAAGGGETKKCQAVAVVGYGTEGGTNYWTMKNSWGAEWGERGFFRLERGVSMCGVGTSYGIFKCAKAGGPVFAAQCEGEDGECDAGEEDEVDEGDEDEGDEDEVEEGEE